MTEKSVDDGLPDMCMRKLTMKLKEKLEITKKPSKNENDNKVVMLGLDAAGKTTILYKLHIGEVLSTVPTIENIESETKLVVLRDDDVKMIEKSVDDVKMTEKSVDDGLHDMSILTRMLKEKLEITKRTSKNVNDNTVVKLGLDAAGKTYSSNLSPSKDSASVTMKRVVFSENCESESKLVIMRDNDVKMTEKSVDDGLHDRSMRKLTMMLKEKLEITRKPSKNENDNKTSARTALQVTSENRILGHPMDF